MTEKGEKEMMREAARQEVEKLLEEWQRSLVCFVSGSEKKLELLKKAKIFGEVEQRILPVDNEAENHRTFKDTYIDHVFALFKTEAPQAVAKGKLVDLLLSQRFPDDVFLLAVDTMPQFFPETDEAGNDLNNEMVIEAISIERPKTIEEAKRITTYVFKTIVRDYIHFRDMLHAQSAYMNEMGRSEDKTLWTLLTMLRGRLGVTVKINTGVAIRFPYAKKIETFSEEIHVYPQVLYDMVDEELGTVFQEVKVFPTEGGHAVEEIVKKLDSAIQTKVDEVITLQGERVLQVSGGIDYSDPKVRTCLRALVMKSFDIIPEEDIKPEWFQGIPIEAIKKYLEASAHDLVTSKYKMIMDLPGSETFFSKKK